MRFRWALFFAAAYAVNAGDVAAVPPPPQSPVDRLNLALDQKLAKDLPPPKEDIEVRNDTKSKQPLSHEGKPVPPPPPPPMIVPPVMEEAALQLRSLIVSHGNLVPDFDPSVYKYTVTLDAPTDQVAIVPEVDKAGVQTLNSLPQVTISVTGETDVEPEPSALAIKRQIDLPDDGSDSLTTIRVASPFDASYSIYKVLFKQRYPPPTALKLVEGYDDAGNAILVEPSNSQDDSVYKAYVHPEATKLTLKIGCNTGSSLKVNGRASTNGGELVMKRDKTRHVQLVDVTCAKKINYPNVPAERKYAVLVMSDWQEDEILPPRLTVDEVGRDCVFDENKESYKCPDPKTDSRKTRLISANEPTIKFVLSNSNGQTEVRLLNKQPTVPFTYTSGSLTLTAYSGQVTKSWPVSFTGTALPSMLQVFGWVLAILLAVLLFSLAGVIGAANIFGLGVPLGATEIAATLTLIIQYLCFANFMRGSTVLNKMVAPLKWVTIFWPLPWPVGDSLRLRQLSGTHPEPTHSLGGLDFWGESTLGDVTDIRNACGCIFWCCIGFALFVLVHSAVYFKFAVLEKEYTFPHRISWGNWESRVLHLLAFPSAAGCGIVLASDIPGFGWKVAAGIVLACYVIWVALAFHQVRSAVADRKVCWIWNSSVREDGSLEDESGYWMDVEADQLLTQPVNRSLCKGLFPYRWISTVADVVPVSLSQALFHSSASEIFPPAKYPRAHKESAYPLAKNPQIVEVVRSRAPGGPCKGQRLVAGLFRTQWLDILLTYQGLTRFHSQIYCDSGSFTIPLIVKTAQLSGPLASGRNAFFYDGARIPFIRIADFLYRIVLGVLVGLALASEGHRIDAAMFSLITLVSLGFVAYVATTRPYSRVIENWLVVAMLGTIAMSAASFVFYAAKREDPSWIADLFLWVVAVCCFILAAYSCVITFSVFSALFCPPLEESRFLEKLANCNVTVSDEPSGWAFDVPAFSKFPVRDLKAHCTLTGAKRVHVTIYASGEEPSLEFSSSELKNACRSGYLVPPVCTIFVPANESSLGYKHFSVSNKDQVHQKIAAFLTTDHETRPIANEVGRHIAHQVEVKGRGKTILSVTVIPPKGVEFAAIPTHSGATTSSGSMSRRSKGSAEMTASQRRRQPH